MNKDTDLQVSLNNLSKKVLPKSIGEFHKGLYIISSGDPKLGLEKTSKLLNFDYEFLLQFVVSIIKQDKSLVRFVLDKSVDQIFESVRKQGLFVGDQDAMDLKNYLLSIYALSRGSDFDMHKIAQEVSQSIDPYAAKVFYQAAKGSIKKFDAILDSLGLVSQK
jgi:H+/gluconate symporter-like permease